MKKLFFVFFVFILCFAGSYDDTVKVVQEKKSNLVTCSTPSLGGTVTEGFEGTGYENSWTESSTPNEDYDISSLSPPTGGCGEGLYVVMTGGNERWSYYDHGSTIDIDSASLTITFYVYIPTDYTGDGMQIAAFGDSTDPTVSNSAKVWLYFSDPNLQLYAQGSTSSSNITITADAWHKVVVILHTTGSSSTIEVDDGGTNTFTRSAGNDVRYFHLGGVANVNAADSGEEVIFDLFYY